MSEQDGYAYALPSPIDYQDADAGPRSPVAPEPAADDVRQHVGIPAQAFAGS
ncbi:hypothetical protein [Streptomyces coeruleofuscus]|uniref:Uncharacterized protein n=1 Tax=Streptomyces coeruleofuscus TaxID=66879 RepID=A0ABP5UUA5_9ACTN